jgi:hypothetical protein
MCIEEDRVDMESPRSIDLPLLFPLLLFAFLRSVVSIASSSMYK